MPINDKDYLFSAAKSVDFQLTAHPGLGIPVDPDIAEFMGAFDESALEEHDLELEAGDEGISYGR
jgi:hypothetical protein